MSSTIDQYLGRIIIGTANFNSDYGLTRNTESAENLLSNIWALGIRRLDLSNKYSFGLKDLNSNNQKWRIQFKVSIDTNQSRESYYYELDNALSNTNGNRIERVLIHNGDEFLYRNDLKKLEEIFQMTPDNIQFGISLYESDHLEKIIKSNFVKVIQFPANIFDRRLANFKNNYKIFTDLNNKILQARSVFLQGLILNNYMAFPKNLIQFREYFDDWYLWNDQNKFKLLESSLTEVLSHQQLDEITIGIDSSDHLKQLATFGLIQKRYSIPLKIPDILIDPRKWSL
jgi:aryl-alcohol dehydrogenase-like predicted oxidoreductase